MEKLENLWQQVNAQCCKEASLNNMSAWSEIDYCPRDCGCDENCNDKS